MVVVGPPPPPLLPPPQSGSPRIPVLQELDGVVEALLVGFCEELEWSVGELLDEDCVVVRLLCHC